MNDLRDFDAQRRRILRRMTLLTWGLWGAVVALALAGGALLAWMFGGTTDLPFTALWLLIAAALVAVPATIHVVVRALEGRRDRRGDSSGNEDGEPNGG